MVFLAFILYMVKWLVYLACGVIFVYMVVDMYDNYWTSPKYRLVNMLNSYSYQWYIALAIVIAGFVICGLLIITV